MNKPELLTPENCQLIFIDHQPQMAFGVQSIDRQVLKNNTVALAKAAKVFGIPVTITTVETESFAGHTYPELLAVFPEHPLLERTSMNSWDDQKVRDALKRNGQKKVVVSGLWTEVCNNTFAFSAMSEGGYEIYMVADASGGTTKEAHDYSMQRASLSTLNPSPRQPLPSHSSGALRGVPAEGIGRRRQARPKPKTDEPKAMPKTLREGSLPSGGDGSAGSGSAHARLEPGRRCPGGALML